MPEEWKKCRMTPIFKGKGKRPEGRNWRMIGGGTTGGKIYEKILEKKLREKIGKEGGDDQFGFVPGRDTIMAVACMKEEIRRKRRRGEEVKVMSVDISKAYDHVDHDELV